MPYHRFKVGQTVVAPSGVRYALTPRGPYVIVRLLPAQISSLEGRLCSGGFSECRQHEGA